LNKKEKEMRKYHESNMGNMLSSSEDISFSESMTTQEFEAAYGQAWDDGRSVALGDSDMEYCDEVGGVFVITGMNDGRVDVWTATRFIDIEGYVWESDSFTEEDSEE
jgi:hypothetical protein